MNADREASELAITAVRFAVDRIESTLLSGQPVSAAPHDALAFVSLLWWHRLLGILPAHAVASLDRQLAESGLTVTEYFSILADRRAPAVMTFFTTVRQIAAPRPIPA